MFNDIKLSNALNKIAFMYKYKIITDDVLKEFTQETQDWIRNLSKDD